MNNKAPARFSKPHKTHMSYDFAQSSLVAYG